MHCTYKINGIAMWINPLPFDTLPNESGCAYAGEKKHQSGSWSKHTAREQAGYTQDALSERMGITPNHLSAIERGVSGISLETLSRLCRLLGVSADRILFGSSVADADAQALARCLSELSPSQREAARALLSAIAKML